ncbi:probable tRNA (guanine(26)-N(2))-dimethyltransferase [Orussus abietinus]|uniref:probable tRNA (guanine(26)-N(2))-dimethyltransferase n=1 Tax=Orussus abietinus TaxID=222816 RepID=UPI000625B2B2|nr:probable tRNA (guanine(26)-N(2))-dimethyltransferase [Orussus abietinus]XP_023290653.1 probable tRNA (guanine(26)-N(2))-dimethyltransferase [Orussus abietinus]
MGTDENADCPVIEESRKPEIIKEGRAEILVHEKNVFYNPVQEFNRDLSIAVLSVFAKQKPHTKKKTLKPKETEITLDDTIEETSPANENGITVLEALSATGLRSIRYAKEVPGIKQIIANDISMKAVESIKRNIHHNGVQDIVTANHEDATMLMYRHRNKRFNAVDIDPYGCPSIFLDAAVQSVSDGGLLLITATDMAVLAGNSPETCYVKYGAVSLKSKACHEIALRILLQHIVSHAGRYGRYVHPLLSISADFYIRVFVKVYSSQSKCKENTSKLGMLYQCVGCETMTTQPLGQQKSNGGFKLPAAPSVDRLCPHCHHKHHIGGPIWLGPLHDQAFISQLLCSLNELDLNTSKRIEGVLNVIHEELDVPLYYTTDRLMSIVRCHVPSMMVFRSAILNAGFSVSYSHANRNSLKTDAPSQVIWDIVRAWEKENPAKRDKFEANSPGLAILTSPSTTTVFFDIHPLANPLSRQKHLSRFQENPTPNWGPGTRSTTMIDSGEVLSKKRKNQNKKQKKQSLDKSAEVETDDKGRMSEGVEAGEPPVKQAR